MSSFTIGEAAKIVNISPSALRYYEKMGLLPCVHRTHNGLRVYSEADVKWLLIIEYMKKTGMSIRNIKQYIELCRIGDAAIIQRMKMIEQQKDLIVRKI